MIPIDADSSAQQEAFNWPQPSRPFIHSSKIISPEALSPDLDPAGAARSSKPTFLSTSKSLMLSSLDVRARRHRPGDFVIGPEGKLYLSTNRSLLSADRFLQSSKSSVSLGPNAFFDEALNSLFSTEQPRTGPSINGGSKVPPTGHPHFLLTSKSAGPATTGFFFDDELDHLFQDKEFTATPPPSEETSGKASEEDR